MTRETHASRVAYESGSPLFRKPVTPELAAALTALNEAAYAAQKAARKSGHPFAARLLAVAHETDSLKDMA